jgi:hypothetical protein
MYTIQVLNAIWFAGLVRMAYEKFYLKIGYIARVEGETGDKKTTKKAKQ